LGFRRFRVILGLFRDRGLNFKGLKTHILGNRIFTGRVFTFQGPLEWGGHKKAGNIGQNPFPCRKGGSF